MCIDLQPYIEIIMIEIITFVIIIVIVVAAVVTTVYAKRTILMPGQVIFVKSIVIKRRRGLFVEWIT